MDANDMIMISVDDHLVEPPDLFENHLPASYAGRDEAPRVHRRRDGSDVWMFNGQKIPNVGLNAVAGRPKDEYGIEPTAFDEMRPGCWNIHDRIKDMNAGGVLGSMCFPSFPGFSGRVFSAADDKDFALAVLRAYNDWHVDEWCGTYPGRFIPMGLVPLWDASLAGDEVRRLAAKGAHSITFTENPATLGFDSFHRHFPDLRIALSEGGTGWIPYFLDRLDRTYDMHHLWTGQDFGDRLPSEVFRRHFLTCFISDPVGVQLRHMIGIDNISWECDYPHSDSSWPSAPEELVAVLAADVVPDDEVAKITRENAMRWYSFDPFAHRPRAQSTVGALRAEAGDWDVSTRSYDKGRFEISHTGTDLGKLAEQATA